MKNCFDNFIVLFSYSYLSFILFKYYSYLSTIHFKVNSEIYKSNEEIRKKYGKMLKAFY